MNESKKQEKHNLNAQNITMGTTSISKPTLSIRHNITVQHLDAALLFYKNCYKIEKEHEGEPLGNFFTEIRSYVIASVILAAATLEAYINEIFTNVHDGIIKNIEESTKLTIIEKWEEIEKDSTLDKYKNYLKYSNKTQTKINNEYFYPKILIEIRNGLVHYKPKWDYEKTTEEFMESQLNHLKKIIEFSPFLNDNSPLFPMRCMTHSFVKWAIETVLNFIKWFEETAGLENKFERFREQLKMQT